jgi:hypothetical protein
MGRRAAAAGADAMEGRAEHDRTQRVRASRKALDWNIVF